MRRVLPGDIAALADVLARVPEGARAALCARALDEAHWGDLYRRRLGRVHTRFGDGTLAGWCAAWMHRKGKAGFYPEGPLGQRHALMVIHRALWRRAAVHQGRGALFHVSEM